MKKNEETREMAATHKPFQNSTIPLYERRMEQNCVQLQDCHGTASSGIVRIGAIPSVRGHGVVASYSLWMREVRGSTPRGPLWNYFFDRRTSPISSKYHFGQASRLSERGSAKHCSLVSVRLTDSAETMPTSEIQSLP